MFNINLHEITTIIKALIKLISELYNCLMFQLYLFSEIMARVLNKYFVFNKISSIDHEFIHHDS